MNSSFVVAPFKILIDSREQAPFRFEGFTERHRNGTLAPLLIEREIRGLKTGDYSIDGHDDRVAVERKSLDDFLHCCGADRQRFEQQLERLSELQHSAIVIESPWSTILSGGGRSEVNRKAVYRSVIAWQFRYRVHWWFCWHRRFAEVTTLRFLERYWKEQNEK